MKSKSNSKVQMRQQRERERGNRYSKKDKENKCRPYTGEKETIVTTPTVLNCTLIKTTLRK
jgi:hypothetical protein